MKQAVPRDVRIKLTQKKDTENAEKKKKKHTHTHTDSANKTTDHPLSQAMFGMFGGGVTSQNQHLQNDASTLLSPTSCIPQILHECKTPSPTTANPQPQNLNPESLRALNLKPQNSNPTTLNIKGPKSLPTQTLTRNPNPRPPPSATGSCGRGTCVCNQSSFGFTGFRGFIVFVKGL